MSSRRSKIPVLTDNWKRNNSALKDRPGDLSSPRTLQKSSQEKVEVKGALKKANTYPKELNTKLHTVSSNKSNKAKANHKETSADKIKKQEKMLNDFKAEIEIADAEFMKQEQELNNLQEKTTNQINELTSANDELRTRLSAQLGAKLQDNNPNIADLSDPNRPTKIGDQFSEFYDDEWTNCYEVMVKEQKSEEIVVDMLLRACSTIYKHCIERASADLQQLHDVFSLFNSGSDIQLLKRLKDGRKKYKADLKLQNEMAIEMTNVFGQGLFKHTIIKTYCQKCLDICWSMAIQDPPLFMDTQIDRKGQPFDNDSYRPYTQAGPLVKFIVWPAIYLNEGGSLLFKGIAQGMVESDLGSQSLRSNKKSSRK